MMRSLRLTMTVSMTIYLSEAAMLFFYFMIIAAIYDASDKRKASAFYLACGIGAGIFEVFK